MKRAMIALVLVTNSLFAMGAHAQCAIEGVISAAPSGDPALPAWQYTLVVTWNTGSQYAVSHVDLLLDTVGGSCSCNDFTAALTRVSPAGTSDGMVAGGSGPCTVSWDSLLECKGDPSIPGIDGILLKFEPIGTACEPGNVGTATYVFYSELAPVPVDQDILSLTDKFALNYCFGHVSGVFPGMDCNPVPNADAAWGAVKGLYR